MRAACLVDVADSLAIFVVSLEAELVTVEVAEMTARDAATCWTGVRQRTPAAFMRKA